MTTRTLYKYDDYTDEKFILKVRLFDGLWTHKHYVNMPIPKEKVYVIDDSDETGTLRAMKVIKVYYGPYKDVLIYAKVAGLGYRYLTATTGFYDSKEDFEKNKVSNIWSDKEINIADAVNGYGEMLYEGTDAFYVRRYKWEENHPVYTESKYAVCYDMTTGMTRIVDLDRIEYIYSSEQDARSKNSVIVCEFDDEEEDKKKKDVVVDVITSFTFSSDLSEEEINERIRESFKGKDYRAFINQKLVIDNA